MKLCITNEDEDDLGGLTSRFMDILISSPVRQVKIIYYAHTDTALLSGVTRPTLKTTTLQLDLRHILPTKMFNTLKCNDKKYRDVPCRDTGKIVCE